MNEGNKILIVDDDPQALKLLKRILEQDYVLELVRSGKEAFQTIPHFKPDLILLDIMMPEIDGYEICRWLRTDKKFHLTKVILVSGKDSLDERLQGYEAGADDYVVKPFEREEIKAKVKVFLRLKRSEEVDQIKGNLLTLFSHETKTPLSSIIGLSSLLRKNDALDEESKEYAQLIHESGNELLEFVKKTSLLCELKNGKKLNFSRDHLEKNLSNVMKESLEYAQEAGLTCELQVERELALNADWDMLNLVFRYILENAVKFSNKEGRVTISAQADQQKCHIKIQDEGDGIAPEWIDSIFGEFAIQDISHHKRGQGLSLAICKHIVDLHHGTILAESTQGKGATFTVSLPL